MTIGAARGRRSWLRLLLATVLLLAGPVLAQEAVDANELRERLSGYDAELGSLASEGAEVRAQAESVRDELAQLDREENLGPVKRARYSQLKQLSGELSDRLTFLNNRTSRIKQEYEDAARRLLVLIEPEIVRLRRAYREAPVDSERRVRLFREYEALVAERNSLRSTLLPSVPYLRLDVAIEPDDTAEALRSKADLLADNVDVIARLLSTLSNWKRELTDARAIQDEVRRLEEENDFFHRLDPLTPGYLRDRFEESDPVPALPPALEDLRDRLALPSGDRYDAADFDRLIASIEVLEQELEEDILSRNERRELILDEAARREGIQ